MKEREVISRGLATVPSPPGLSLGGWEGGFTWPALPESSLREKEEQPALEEMGPPLGLHCSASGMRTGFPTSPLPWSVPVPSVHGPQSWELSLPACLPSPMHKHLLWSPFCRASRLTTTPVSLHSPKGEEAKLAGIALVLTSLLLSSVGRQRKVTEDKSLPLQG